MTNFYRIVLKSIFFSVMIFGAVSCFSQDTGNSEVRNVTKATFFNPGFSYELKVGRFQTLYSQVFMNTSFGLGYSSSLGSTSFIYFDPALTVQYRYYYNYSKREAKGLRTKMNSLNYVCALIQTIFSKGEISSSYLPETNRRAVNSFGIAWGFQRNYQKRFSLDLNLGAGYLYARSTTENGGGGFTSRNVGQFTALGQLNLGFWLNKRN